MCEKGTIPQVKVQHKEQHFTLLGFTALDGSSVLCLIVIAGVKGHLQTETGIDPTAEIIGGSDQYFCRMQTLDLESCFLAVQHADLKGKISLVW